MRIDQKFVPVLCLVFGLALGYAWMKWSADMNKERGVLSPQQTEVKQLSGNIKSSVKSHAKGL